ncbi:uncharacterized protein akap12a [Tautogolabrus adspersus]
MGDAQSAQREGMKDEAGEEESGKVDDAQAEQSPEDKPFKNNGQISEINEKAGSSVAEVNDHCEDEIATDAVLPPDEEVTETEKPLEEGEETPSKYIERNEIESSNEADVAEDVPLDMIEMDAKTNDINDGFRRFFSNIGLRLSIKRGSTDLLRDLPDETNHDEPSGQENLEDSAEEIQIEDAEQNTDVNTAQVSTDNDSTTCPTMTDVTPEDVLENAEEKATEAKEDVESDNADESITSPAVEDTHTRPEEEPNSLSPPEQEEVVSPIKRFFTTGIFSGLRKKRKTVEDDVNEKEMVDMGKKEAVEFAEETEYDQQEDKEQIDPGVEAAVVDTEHKENELKQEILTVTSAEKADEGKSPTTDHSTAIDTTTIFPESETLNSHEKDKVQASPLKRLLSGSSFKKLSKKPRSRRSSDAKLSDSGEHAADQLLSSTESTENQKEDKSTQPSPEAAGEEDGTWVSFKKLLTPKKHTRTPSLSNKETEIPDSVQEPKPSDGEQISDPSTEEGKKRKDSSVSWEAVLCGSGKKRSRKTSDSEDESPQIDDNKQDIGSKNGAELPEESANEKKNDVSVSSPKQSPLIGDGGSTWKSFKRLVTPKRKVKDEDEGKDNIQSDSEVSQDESSFSIKKLLPGRKKRKTTEKQDHVSSDEADKDVPSDDEDSETPAVVPMSEFDTPESLVQIQTQVDIESHFPKEVPQDLLQKMPKSVLPCDSLQNEAKKLEENVDAVDNGTSTMPAKIEQLDDVSEIISKHQQLSDITEEGIITETMATPVSINEDVGRDDTLAEDLLEITSEAITAPELASVTTLADETEMISAVSQLSSESSKTSGNTTPVPAEYEVKETEELLHQVVENISTSPMAVPISSATPKSESIVGSVLHHIFRTFVKEDKETTILEIHRKSDATAINTGQTAEELDAVNEVAAKAQTESISEVNDSNPKEFLPEVLEKLDTAEITKDEVHEVNPIDPEQSLKELKRIHEIENDSHHQVESQSEANAAGSVLESLEAEMETPEMGTEDTPSKEFKEETEPEGELLVKTAETDVEDTVKDSKTEVACIDTHVVTESTEEETLTNEPQPRTEVRDEPEKNVPVEAVTTEYVQEPEVLPSDIEETVKETRSKEGALTDLHVITESTEMGMATLPLIEGALEPVDHSKTEWVQEPEQLQTVQPSRLESKAGSPLIEQILSDDITAVATFTDEHTLEAEVRMEPEEEQPVEASKTEYVQEQKVLPSDAKDNVKETKTEEHTSMYKHAVTETTVPTPDADNTIASVTDTIEREAVAQFHQAAEESDGHKTELIINNAHVFEQEDSIPEVTEELQAIPQAHVSSVDEESKYVQVLEKTIFPEDLQAPAVDNATIKNEFKHEVHLSAVQLSVEREKESELSSTEINTAALEYAIVTQVVTCDMKEVSATIPDLLPEKTLDITEPMIDRVASQEVFGEANTTKPLVKDDAVTAEQNTLIQRMHVPSVEFEGNHKIQVQVVDVNLKSAGTIVDNVLEVGVKETKEVIDYCQETMKTVENLSATPDIKKEFTHGETKITVQEVIPHVPEKVSESAVTILEKAVIKQPDALTAVSELAESESNQMGNKNKVVKDGTGTLTEKDEKYFVIIDDSAIAQQVSVHLTHTQDLPFGLNVSIGSQREKLEQTKAKQAKSEAGVTVGEVKALSEESDVEEVNEPAQITQISQGPIVTPSNTGLVVPQNTGIMSSIGNLGSPSSLSLEFKLNLQFGQAKAQTPSPPTEKIEPMNKTHVSDVGVQGSEAVEPVKPIIPTQRAESHNQIDLTEVKVKPATNFVYTERALITTQPDLSDSGINTIETVESITKGPAFPPMPTNRIETVKQTDVIVVGVQAVESVETVKPIIPTESAGSEKQIEPTVVNVAPKEITGPDSLLVLTERAVITTQPVLLDVAIHAIETVELVSKAQTSQSLAKIMDCTEPVKQMDVFEDGSQAIQALETSLTKIEAAEVNEQPTEITKPAANLVLIERALITTHPQILEVGMHFFKTVEREAKASDSLSSTTDRTETEKETDVSVVGFQALKATEPANTVIPPEKETQKQIEPTEVNNQSTEITESATILESTKRAVITTVGIHPTEAVELVEKTMGSAPPTTDIIETLKQTDVIEVGFVSVEAVKPVTALNVTQSHENQEQIEPTEVNDQPIEITELVATLVERALITTQPELFDVGINTIQTVEQEATAPPSSPAITERIELGKQMNISEHGVQAEEAEEPYYHLMQKIP